MEITELHTAKPNCYLLRTTSGKSMDTLSLESRFCARWYDLLGWGAIYMQCWQGTICFLLEKDSWSRVFLCWDTNLGTMTGQMLKRQQWGHGSLVCAICYPCAIYAWQSGQNSRSQSICYFFLTFSCVMKHKWKRVFQCVLRWSLLWCQAEYSLHFILNFIPCVFYSVFTNNLQMQFFTVLLLHSTAAECFDARASSSGNFSVPAELHSKRANVMVSSGW
jgi:hypothetical protein